MIKKLYILKRSEFKRTPVSYLLKQKLVLCKFDFWYKSFHKIHTGGESVRGYDIGPSWEFSKTCNTKCNKTKNSVPLFPKKHRPNPSKNFGKNLWYLPGFSTLCNYDNSEKMCSTNCVFQFYILCLLVWWESCFIFREELWCQMRALAQRSSKDHFTNMQMSWRGIILHSVRLNISKEILIRENNFWWFLNVKYFKRN